MVPANCEEITLPYLFAWTTNGTYCETPYKFFIGGNPWTEANTWQWSLSEDVSGYPQIVKSGVSAKWVTAADLANLTTDNGIYHWVVTGWSGSHPASQTFRVKQ
ncbi:MAG: hypothetical protein A3C43_08865 [Candidatus Schekmanbacteria bacterium RIFCSPHIGHO2_02_FULL_38_11]|uniref:Uncharacterized protein n=1 Tax=Candidatus Schekmanbacteria bacterium RIFCSPLOWO2_12_FULL_38_15 TaxID=1817883 RepID=A0A1F7SL87_9BACT|nr:MAG: hypothetical protein A2043_09135 [Candidatus Schekmanbacteria bacterium GWA2_38_9]OGL47963.1 MAG: hypothetical protein A3H37_08010 [Candidatus Schekmanbacteria bacterium RIFCSPLOWO2_02_FULL_38_14]OGL49020.1 MAG: hypothetical protein A3C43_08865 [Candidatus Schekmanbacteria bacterium RIFCSPHIGHO2_02_FULL_38_11]OGL54552.1 MAG: hypothetical protein A3G31_10380 [Candidatus Schekmanbacteria bacterium RIFCSPLOWO2_12_FULL_38_15]